jgi:hypothetical protein
MQTSHADEAARPISTESPIENELSTVNRDNNTGKPSGILISTENERTLLPVNTFLNRDSKNEFNQDPTGNTSGAMRCLSSTGSSSESDPTSTWTALLTQSMSVLSGGGDLVGSDLLNGRDCSPDADHRVGKHCSTDPGVCVSYKRPIVSTQSALPTQSALLTQSALHTQSKPILPGGRGKGSVSSDLTPHDDLNTGNHFITRFLRQTGITTPMDGCSQIPLVNSA